MPSSKMIRRNVDLYPEQESDLVSTCNSHNVPITRFMRGCIIFVLSDKTLTLRVIEFVRKQAWRRNG